MRALTQKEFDCQKCGACCADQLILLTTKDTKVPIHLRDGRFMKNENGHCVALIGRVGVKVSCSIYDCQPEMCAFLPAGSPPCLTIRRAHGLNTGE